MLNQTKEREMENHITNPATRLGAYTAIGGGVCGLLGAALWGASGADLDEALASGDIANYLTVAGEKTPLIVTGLTVWIVMALLFGAAATVMTALCAQRPALAQIARYSYWTGVPLAIASFVAWLAIVVQVAPDTSPTAVLMTEVVGWFASRADWLATILLIGTGPTLISLAGRGEWVPTWLERWGMVTIVTSILTVVAMFTGSGLSTYGFLLVPIGVGWMIAAGIVLLRRIGAAQPRVAA
jgi:hypothetical protein